MSQEKIRVLVVEDNVIAQLVAKSMLSDLGCDVDIASTGAEAIQRVAQKTYGVIFMDLGLPDRDGVQVALAIKKMEIVTPIVALTAHQDEQLKQQCQEVGVKKYLVKPLTVENAQATLQELIPTDISMAV